MENNSPNNPLDNQPTLDTTPLSAIYLQLSENPYFEGFDFSSSQNEVSEIMQEIYNDKFQAIETKILQKEIDLINKSFAKLVSNTPKNKHAVGFLFLEYCHYFDLDVHITYKSLHPNFKNDISKYLENLMGSDLYKKTMKKLNVNHGMKTLFDLIQKKQTKQTNPVEVQPTYKIKYFSYLIKTK